MNYFQQANNLYNIKDYKKAIYMYKKSIELEGLKAVSLYNSAVCFIKLHLYDKAIGLLQQAILEKKDSRYFYNLGYCYLMKKNYKKALIYFNTAWSLNNDDLDCEKAINLIMKKYKSS